MKRSEPTGFKLLASEWRAAIAVSGSAAVEKVPAGWVTMRQFATMLEISISQASKVMRDLVTKEDAEVRKFCIESGRGPFKIPHYRLLKGKR